MRHTILFVLSSFILFSCKQTKEDLILKKWQAVSVKSAQLDQQIAEERNFIDTVGKSTDPATNELLYGIRNMDSMREVMRLILDSTVAAQDETVKNTWLDFKKDGIVVTHFADNPDTVSWYFEDESTLMFDELKQKGAGSKIKMEVLKLDEQTLQLQFVENGFSSTATFHPAK